MGPRVLFLNQYFPPDRAPTGALLRELGDHLETQGWETDYVASGQEYGAAKTGSRAVRELAALWRIFIGGLNARQPDVVVSASSPPGLAVVAALVAWRHRARGVHWLMDLYPELATSLGEIRDGPLARGVRALMHAAYRRCAVIVALDDDMAERVKAAGVPVQVIAPWVLLPMLRTQGDPPPSPELVWTYSGNLGRAHEWETLLQAQAILEQRGAPWRLRFQGAGPSWPKAQQRAAELGLRQCEWKGFAPEGELRASLAVAHVLVITQRPETRGLLWPSKLALAMDVGRPVLWVGPTDGAIARELRQRADAGIFAPGDAEGIADWLLGEKAPATLRREAAEIRREALERWAQLLRRVVST